MRTARFSMVFLIVVLLAFAGAYGYRRHQMQSWYNLIMQPDTEIVAVNELAGFSGPRSTKLLLEIASNPQVFPENRVAAVQALARRQNAQISTALASLLRPHNGLDLRSAVAAALQNMPCPIQCARSVLHYQERIWRGELNFEDRYRDDRYPSGGIDEKRQEQMYRDLDSVLRREKTSALQVLTDTYGLGGAYPSDFAVHEALVLGSPEACAALRVSLHETTRDATPLREKLEEVRKQLNCGPK